MAKKSERARKKGAGGEVPPKNEASNVEAPSPTEEAEVVSGTGEPDAPTATNVPPERHRAAPPRPPWRGWQPWALLLLSSVLMFLGFAGFGIWPLGLVAPLPALFVLDPAQTAHGYAPPRGRAFFWRALFFGTAAYTGGFYWIEYTLRLFSDFHVVFSSLFSTIFWAFQGLQFVLMLWLFARARDRGWPAALALPAAYLATEGFFPMLFEHYYGSTLLSVPVLVQVAELGGPTLTTLAIFLPAGALYDVLDARLAKRPLPRLGPGLAVGYLLFVVAFGVYRLGDVATRSEAAPHLTIGLVQPNLGLFDRAVSPREALRAEVAATRRLEDEHDPDLVVWPESSVLFWLDEPENVGAIVHRGLSTPLLFGGIRHGEVVGDSEREHNTAFLTDLEGDVVGTYDKAYLLAFGEYLPFGETFPVLYDISPASGRFSPGDDATPLELETEDGERYRLQVLICYEDIVSSYVRRAVNEGDPHLLVNMTVDSWFGDTQEPDVHLGLARFRAIEHRRYLVRATNSGVSAIIDATGAVTARSGLFVEETIAGDVAMMSGTTTLFAMLGHWPAYLALVAVIWIANRRAPASLPR